MSNIVTVFFYKKGGFMAIGKPNKITLDLYINKHVFTRVAQYDINSREVIIKITDKGVPFPINSSQYSVRIEYLKSDRTSIINDIPVENILPDGTIRLVLSIFFESRLLSASFARLISLFKLVVIVDSAFVDLVVSG